MKAFVHVLIFLNHVHALADGRLARVAPRPFGAAFVHPVISRASIGHKYSTVSSRIKSSSDATIDASNNSSPEEIARQLRKRAQDLRREAMVEEQSLKKAAELKRERERKEADDWIDALLGVRSEIEEVAMENSSSIQSSIPSVHTLVLRLKEYNLLSSSKLTKIAGRLHDRETSMLIGPEAMLSKPVADTSGDFVLGDYENNSLERKMDENQRIAGLLDRLMEAVQLVDDEGLRDRLAPSIRIRVTELRQSREALLRRRIDGLVQSGMGLGDNNQGIDDLARSSMHEDITPGANDEKELHEKMMKRLIETPSWLPSSLAPFAATSPVEVPIPTWKLIKSELLTNDDFICTSWDATEVAAVFRGRTPRRTTDEETEDARKYRMSIIFNNLVARLDAHSGLKDKVQLFLVDDNEWSPPLDTGLNTRLSVNEDTSPPPVIIAMAKEVVPEQESERRLGVKTLGVFSTLLTTLTSLAYALSSFALNPGFFNAVVNDNDVSLVPICLPIFFGVLAMSALHELGHYAAARKYNLKLGWPVPLPSFQVGSFGCITPFRSFPSSRTAVFDVATCGPGLTMIVSILMLVAGLNMTAMAKSFSAFPMVPAAVMKSSFLIGSIASVIMPKAMLVPLSQPISVHPFVMIGLAGLIMSAVNLLPIGRLDGGRASMAAFGRRTASALSFISLLVMAFYSFTGSSGVIIFWGALVVMTQRLPDIPAMDEFTGITKFRSNGYICLLLLGESCNLLRLESSSANNDSLIVAFLCSFVGFGTVPYMTSAVLMADDA